MENPNLSDKTNLFTENEMSDSWELYAKVTSYITNHQNNIYAANDEQYALTDVCARVCNGSADVDADALTFFIIPMVLGQTKL